MTTQLCDIIEHEDECYIVTGVWGRGLFEPVEQGLTPHATCTACYRGYVCHYRVENSQLVLETLWLTTHEPPPDLFGHPPQPSGRPFRAQYHDLGHSLLFTGGILAGTGFIPSLRLHLNLRMALRYERVHAFIFEAGHLVRHGDCSRKAAEMRERLLKQGRAAG